MVLISVFSLQGVVNLCQVHSLVGATVLRLSSVVKF